MEVLREILRNTLRWFGKVELITYGFDGKTRARVWISIPLSKTKEKPAERKKKQREADWSSYRVWRTHAELIKIKPSDTCTTTKSVSVKLIRKIGENCLWERRRQRPSVSGTDRERRQLRLVAYVPTAKYCGLGISRELGTVVIVVVRSRRYFALYDTVQCDRRAINRREYLTFLPPPHWIEVGEGRGTPEVTTS